MADRRTGRSPEKRKATSARYSYPAENRSVNHVGSRPKNNKPPYEAARTGKPRTDSHRTDRYRTDGYRSEVYRTSKYKTKGPKAGKMRAVEGGLKDSSRRKRSYPKRKSYNDLFFGIMFVLILVYLGGYTYTYFSRPVISETRVNLGSIDQPTVYDGIIVRDETVYKAETLGVVMYYVNEFDKVKKGGSVCSVQDQAKVAEYEANLASIDQSMINKQKSREGFSTNEVEIKAKNEQIKKMVETVMFDLAQDDVEGIYSIKNKVQQTMDIRNQLLFSESGVMAGLVSKRDQVQKGLLSAINDVNAVQGGIVAYKTDGLEGRLTLENMATIKKDDIKMKVDYETIEVSRDVKKDDAIFKVVKSNDWYIAAYLPIVDTVGWLENNVKTIYINDGKTLQPLETSVYRLETVGDEAFVIFRANRHMIDFLNQRNIQFQTQQTVIEGYKIPKTAVIDKTKLKIPEDCVSTLEEKKIVTRRVNGMDETVYITTSEEPKEGYYDVIADFNKLSYGDTLVIPGEGGGTEVISEVENVQGVYVTNVGSAVYKQIDTGGNYSENASYIVLDPSLNGGLKIYDKIVSDAKTVTDHQLVY